MAPESTAETGRPRFHLPEGKRLFQTYLSKKGVPTRFYRGEDVPLQWENEETCKTLAIEGSPHALGPMTVNFAASYVVVDSVELHDDQSQVLSMCIYPAHLEDAHGQECVIRDQDGSLSFKYTLRSALLPRQGASCSTLMLV